MTYGGEIARGHRRAADRPRRRCARCGAPVYAAAEPPACLECIVGSRRVGRAPADAPRRRATRVVWVALLLVALAAAALASHLATGCAITDEPPSGHCDDA